MHEVLVNRLGGLSLPKKSVVRLTDRPDMTLDVYRGRKTTMQQIITWFLIVVRQEVSNFDSSVVVHELELAIIRALYGCLCSLGSQ